ncbi:MAG: hypothetical protein HQK50_14095 [Oligoflexia bacterium]|nr:hypothetical protein [Oligoflexia bacterium]
MRGQLKVARTDNNIVVKHIAIVHMILSFIFHSVKLDEVWLTLAAGYGADFIQESAAIGSLGQMATGMASSVGSALIRDVAGVALDNKSYSSTRFLTTLLSGATAGAIGTALNGDSNNTLNKVFQSAATSASNEAIFEIVEENRLNIDTVADRALRGTADGMVSSFVTQNLTPEELRKKLVKKMADVASGFKQALEEMLPLMEETIEPTSGESADGSEGVGDRSPASDPPSTLPQADKTDADNEAAKFLMAYASCFDGATEVLTEHGPRRIADIKAGEQVYSCDVDQNICHLMKVSQTLSHLSDHLLILEITIKDRNGHISTHQVKTTKNHPFYLHHNSMLVNAEQLNVGDRLKSKDDSVVITVVSKEIKSLDPKQSTLDYGFPVYNLEVEGDHNYYVTTGGMLVHNCKGDSGSGPDLDTMLCAAGKYSKEKMQYFYNKLPPEVQDYLYERAQEAPKEALVMLITEGRGKTSVPGKGAAGEAGIGRYAPTAKHGPGGFGSPNPIPDIQTGQKLLDASISSELKKQRFNIHDGKIIKFQPDGTGGWHSYELTKDIQQQVPSDVFKQMLDKKLITPAEFKKFLKL